MTSAWRSPATIPAVVVADPAVHPADPLTRRLGDLRTAVAALAISKHPPWTNTLESADSAALDRVVDASHAVRAAALAYRPSAVRWIPASSAEPRLTTRDDIERREMASPVDPGHNTDRGEAPQAS